MTGHPNFFNCVQVSKQSDDISQTKMSAKAEKATDVNQNKKKKEKKEERAMDEVQPIDSISNVSPN